MNAYEKMREALEAVLCDWEEDGFGFINRSTIKAVKQALAEPRRNCDVGTAEEQFRRYHKFCMGGHGCSKCVVGIFSGAGCSLAWAQMPYEEGGKE